MSAGPLGLSSRSLAPMVDAQGRAEDVPYREVFEHAPDAVIIVDRAGRIVDANRQASRLFGYARDDLIGRGVEDLLPEEVRSVHTKHRAGYALRPTVRPMGQGLPLFALRSDGTRLAVDVSLSPLPAAQPVLYAAAVRDVTAQRQAVEALEESEARLHSVFDASPVGMAIVDASGRFLAVNAALCDLLGFSAEELTRQTLADVTPRPGGEGLHALLAELFLDGDSTFTLEQRYLSRHGRALWVELRLARLQTRFEPRAVVMVSDVTARKRTEAQLTHRALHDELTGAANRGLMLERVDHALAQVPRTGARVGVLFIDLDDFKAVNDRLGHAAGDHVLREVATRISSVVRPYDTVARVGGDEFVVACGDLPADEQAALAQLASLAERLRTTVGAPIPWNEREISLTASVGIAVSPSGGGTSPVELLDRADRAMYAAKQGGRDRVATAPDLAE